MWALLNAWRVQAKLSLTILMVDILLLAVFETAIAGIHKQMLSSVVALFGLIWIITTACVIWFFGGTTADIIAFAAMLDEPTEKDNRLTKTAKEICKPTRLIFRAVKYFFLLGALIVCYFLVVPFWRYWEAHFALMILFMIYTISGNLLGKKWPLPKFRSFSGWVMALLVAGIFFAAGYYYFTGESLTSDKVRDGIKGMAKKAEVSTTDLFKKKDSGEEKVPQLKIKPTPSKPMPPLRLRIPKKEETNEPARQPMKEESALRFPTTGDPQRYIIEFGEELKATLQKPAPRWARWVYKDRATGQWFKYPWPAGQVAFKLENDQRGKSFEVFLELPGEMISAEFPLNVQLEKRELTRKTLVNS